MTETKTIKAGTTLSIAVDVYGRDGLPVNNITAAKFALEHDGQVTLSDCTINAARVSRFFTDAETLAMQGTYRWEVKVKADGEVPEPTTGIFIVTDSLITQAL